ncbi:MinD/ParA family ATP-binding protein [Blastococcus sp. SYSU D00813]
MTADQTIGALGAPPRVPDRPPVRATDLLAGVPAGDRPLARVTGALRGLVTASRDAAALEARERAVVAPVPAGRRIVVAAAKDGGGRTTVTALLASAYAARRADAVLAVDAHHVHASLAWRLGLATAPRQVQLDEYLLGRGGRDLAGVDDVLPRTRTGLRLLADVRGGPPERPRDLARTLSRLFAVTLLDTGPGFDSPWTDVLLADAHGIVLVAEATPEGVERAVLALEQLERAAGEAGLARTTVVLNETVAGSRLRHGPARRLLAERGEHGVPVLALGHDRHLAAGGPVDLRRVARRTVEQALETAGVALSRSLGTGGGEGQADR